MSLRNRFNPNLWRRASPGDYDYEVIEDLDLLENTGVGLEAPDAAVMLEMDDVLFDVPLFSAEVVSITSDIVGTVFAVVGGVTQGLAVVGILVTAVMAIVQSLQEQASMERVVAKLRQAEDDFDGTFSQIADLLGITLPPQERILVQYPVFIPGSRTMSGDPIGGSYKQVQNIETVSRLWTHGPACMKYLEYRLTNQLRIKSPSIESTLAAIQKLWRTMLSTGPLIINSQRMFQMDIGMVALVWYNTGHPNAKDKITNTGTKNWQQYLTDYQKVDVYLQQTNGPRFEAEVRKLMATHKESVTKKTVAVTLSWADSFASYLAAHPEMTVSTVGSLEAAATLFGLDPVQVEQHVFSVASFLSTAGQYFLPTLDDDDNTAPTLIDPLEEYTEPVYKSLESITAKDVTKFKPIAVPEAVATAAMSTFTTRNGYYFNAKNMPSISLVIGQGQGASLVMYNTPAGIAMLIRSQGVGLCHVQSLREASCVVVSPLVGGEFSPRYVRVYTSAGATEGRAQLHDKMAFGVLYHLAVSLSRQSSDKTLYVPDFDIPPSVATTARDFVYRDVDFASNQVLDNLVFQPTGRNLLSADSTQLQKTVLQIVQTQANSGVLYLMKGPTILSALVASADGATVHGIYTSSAAPPTTRAPWFLSPKGFIPIDPRTQRIPTRFNPVTAEEGLARLPSGGQIDQNLMEYFTIGDFIDKSITGNRAFGKYFESQVDAFVEIQKILPKGKFNMLVSNLNLAEMFIANRTGEKLTPAANDVITKDTKVEILAVTDDVVTRGFFEQLYDAIVGQPVDDDDITSMAAIDRADAAASSNISLVPSTHANLSYIYDKTLPSFFYRNATGALECVTVDEEQGMAYRLTRDDVLNEVVGVAKLLLEVAAVSLLTQGATILAGIALSHLPPDLPGDAARQVYKFASQVDIRPYVTSARDGARAVADHLVTATYRFGDFAGSLADRAAYALTDTIETGVESAANRITAGVAYAAASVTTTYGLVKVKAVASGGAIAKMSVGALTTVAGAVITHGVDGVKYFVKKTADMTMQAGGMVIGLIGAIGTAFIVANINTNKRRKLK